MQNLAVVVGSLFNKYPRTGIKKMAKLIANGEEMDLEDNSELTEPCMELGIPFGCQTGVCGTCRIEIVEGTQNLSERTQCEDDMELEPQERLACQCKIKSGIVKIDY